MNFAASIDKDLIAAIVAKCGVSEARAADVLRSAKSAAKSTGLPLADTLNALGVV